MSSKARHYDGLIKLLRSKRLEQTNGEKMALNDPLGAAFSKISNAELIGNKECYLKFSSKLMKNIFNAMKDNSYIGEYEEIPDSRGTLLKVNLLGNINKCGVIKPRYSVKLADYERYEKRYLPAKGFGYLFVSTSQGILTHNEAKKKKLGGRLMAFVY